MLFNLGTPLKKIWLRAVVGGLLATAGLAAQSQTQPQPQPQTLRVMPMGDSITSGFRSTDNNGYRGALRDLLKVDVTGLDFVGTLKDGTMADRDHEGHSGWRIDQVAGIATAALQRYHPNIVTLHLGTNDMGDNYQVGSAPTRLAALIDQIFSIEPDTSIVVAEIIRPSDAASDARTLTYNAQIPAIVKTRADAGKHIVMVDMASALTTADLFDVQHPNDGGYRKMAAVWNAGVRQVIANGWVQAPTPIPTRFIGYQSGRCLDLPNGSQADGTLVQLWDCNGRPNQEWTLKPDASVEVYGGKCLDALRQDTSSRAVVVGINGCNGGAGQQWRLTPDGSIVGTQSGLCLDVNNLAVTNGSKVTLWTCNGGANQKWAQGD